jgi:hypothetical protein
MTPLRWVLVVAILVALTCALGPAWGAQENLALNRPYVCSDDLLPGWTGLTDGVTDSDAAPGCFATGPANRFPKQLVIDLGAVCTISKINVINSKNGNTRRVLLYVSADAGTYEQLREYFFPADAVQTLAHSFTARKARYVKIALSDSWESGAQGPDCLFLREVQVFGEAPAAGTTVSGREELRLAHIPPQFTSSPAVGVFRRYALTTGRKLKVGVLGDGFAAVTAGRPQPWPELLPAVLGEQLGGAGQVELYNLTAPNQGPGDALAVAKPVLGEAPADVLILAYGRDAALAKADVTAFRNACQALFSSLLETPALVVVVTPPPLLQESGATGKSVLPYALAEEQAARQYGLPVVRAGAVAAAAPDPLGCFEGSDLSAAGQSLLAKALRRLLGGAD